MSDTYSHPEKHIVLNNGVKMPMLGLGTSHNGGYSHEAVVYALKECNYRHIDTAKRYGCEKYIAQAIKDSKVDRSEIFLATKCWPTDYGKEKTRSAARASCQRLCTEYLDMYLLHWPEVPTGYQKDDLLRETWRELELLYDEGTVRVIGVSNFMQDNLETLLEDCSVIPHVNQCEFHPFNNPVHLRQRCEENRIQFEGYSPLANGAIFSNPDICSIAKKLQKTCSQVVLRWNVENRVVCIPKSTQEERVKQNGEIFDFELSPEDMALLNSLPQTITVMDRSGIQEKIDNPQPDGYKLKFIKVPPLVVDAEDTVLSTV